MLGVRVLGVKFDCIIDKNPGLNVSPGFLSFVEFRKEAVAVHYIAYMVA